MAIHDWTRVDGHVFHSFHLLWLSRLMGTLNTGLLSDGHYAMVEQPKRRASSLRRHVAIRHVTGHRLVALIEIVSPSNKDRLAHVRELAAKVVRSLEAGIHVLVLDLLPTGRHDPHGLHGAIWAYFERTAYEPPADGSLTLASYVWDGSEPEAYVEPTAVGRPLIDMPLFLSADHYVNVPLETTYLAAYRGMPQIWRDVLERPARSE